MNKQEQLAIKLTAVVVISFLSLMAMQGLTTSAINQNLKRMEIEMHHRLKERDHLDSLYREHLDQCSFIERDDIGVDGRGYLYSKYQNNPNNLTP